MRIESDADIEKAKLENEAQVIRDFLTSPGFLATKDIVDDEISEGIDSLLNLPVVDIATLVTHFRVIGEINANQQFEKRFRSRLVELENEIGTK